MIDAAALLRLRPRALLMPDLLTPTDRGLYCAAGDFYVDPWRPVDRAVVTHAHSDHASMGSQRYLTSEAGVGVLRVRLGDEATIEGVPYGESVTIGQVRVSLHPAGHILGSSQVRIEHAGQVCVVSGDYKTMADDTCAAFEPLRCHTFVTESTFGLPIYRWQPAEEVFREINAWWATNQEQGRTSLIYAYSLGKAQRVLAGLDASIGPILVHGAIARFLPAYHAAGVPLPLTERATQANAKAARGRAMVIAPPSAAGTPWLRKFGPISTAIASGWMQIRGPRRRRAVDRGFALSDHADWNGLLGAIDATRAEQIWVTHGYSPVMVRWFTERGKQARVIPTRYEGEQLDEPEAAAAAE